MASIEMKFIMSAAKMYVAGLAWVGVKAINLAGSQLGLSPPGTTLEKMSFSDILKRLRELGQKLSNPVASNDILNVIKSAGGQVKQAMSLLVEMSIYVADEMCKLPLLSNLCGISELTNDIINNAIKKTKGGSSSSSSNIKNMISKKHKIKSRINKSISNFLHVSSSRNKTKKRNQ